MTDHKAMLSASKFSVLLVDTPEMGGRAALDRLTHLIDQQNLNAVLSLRVHDPDGFDPDSDQDEDRPSGERRVNVLAGVVLLQFDGQR